MLAIRCDKMQNSKVAGCIKYGLQESVFRLFRLFRVFQQIRAFREPLCGSDGVRFISATLVGLQSEALLKMLQERLVG